MDQEQPFIPVMATGRFTTTMSLHLVVISRDMPSLRALVATTRCAQVKLDPDHNEQVSNDIVRVVSANVQKFSWVDGFNSEFERGECSKGLILA